MTFTYKPVTPQTLKDLEAFSAAHGKFRYCSCMRWRLSSSEFSKSSKEERIAQLNQMVCEQIPVGMLAYTSESDVVGWCSIAPRETFTALERSRTLPRIDDTAVWSVTCFFIDRHYRRQKLTLGLLLSAIDYAQSQGATTIEGYPVPPDATSYTYMGSPNTFLQAGFVDVTPSGQKRQVYRFYTKP